MKRLLLGGLAALAIGAFTLPLSVAPHPPAMPRTAMSGDIVLVSGRSFHAIIVKVLGLRHSAPVHIGVLLISESGARIIHSDPRRTNGRTHAGVVIENWETFAKRGSVDAGEVFRVVGADGNEIAREALDYARKSTPFDWTFDWRDRSALYCTELVDEVFRQGGVDLFSEVPKSQNVIYPDQVRQSKHVRLISRF